MSKTKSVLLKFHTRGRTYTIDELADAIDKANEPTFSEISIKGNMAEMVCPTCRNQHRVYRRNWRRESLEVLRHFLDYTYMTTPQIGKFFTGQTALKIPSELVDFGLLKICGNRAGDRLYCLTGLGEKFLDGKEPIPEYVWPEGAPPECEDGPPKYVHEVKSSFPHRSKQSHVSASVPCVV